MIKYSIEGNTTKAWFEDKWTGGSWAINIFNDLEKRFNINLYGHELYDKINNYIYSQPWIAEVTCKGGDKFCPILGKEMAKKKLLKRYYTCLFKCRDMVIQYYSDKYNEAIKKAELGKLACKIYDLEDELRGRK